MKRVCGSNRAWSQEGPGRGSGQREEVGVKDQGPFESQSGCRREDVGRVENSQMTGNGVSTEV